MSGTHRLKKNRRRQIIICLRTCLSFSSLSHRSLSFLASSSWWDKSVEKKNQHTTYTLFIVEGNYNKASEQSNARQTYSAANTIVQFLKLAIRRNFHLKLSKVRKR